MDLKGQLLHVASVLPEFVAVMLVLAAVGMHAGNNSPLAMPGANDTCDSTPLRSCLPLSFNGTVLPDSCMCMADHSFLYTSIVAGLLLAALGRHLFSVPSAGTILWIVGPVLCLCGYTFVFVGCALSISTAAPGNAQVLVIGGFACVCALASAVLSVVALVQKRSESGYQAF